MHFQFYTVCRIIVSLWSINFLSSTFILFYFLFFQFLSFCFSLIRIRYKIFALHPPRYILLLFCSLLSFHFSFFPLCCHISFCFLHILPSFMIEHVIPLQIPSTISYSNYSFFLRLLPFPLSLPIKSTNPLSLLSCCLSNMYFTFNLTTPY